MSIRVLHLTRDYPPRHAGGISTAVAGLVEALSHCPVECAVVSFDGWRPSKARQQETAQPAREGDTLLLRLERHHLVDSAKLFAAEFRPDVIHVHHDMLWELAGELASATGAATVLQVHVDQALQDALRQLGEPTLSARAQARALRDADLVCVPSRTTGASVLARSPGLEERLVVAPLGVRDSERARAAAGSPRPDPCAAYVGRFSDIKGTRELFAAMPRIQSAVPEVRFVIAGGLPENQKSERRWRRQFEEESDDALRRATTFLGWQDELGVSQLLARSRILLAPSWCETFGLAPLEAMFHGVAVIVGENSAAHELVVEGETGLLVPPRDPGVLAETAIRLLRSPQEAERIGQRAAASVRAEATWAHRIAAYTGVYERATGSI